MRILTRVEAPPDLERDPCPLCEANPAEYHQAAPGYPSIKGYCKKCQFKVDDERERADLAFENARRRQRCNVAGNQPPDKKALYLRDFAYNVRARECYEDNNGCPGPGTRGYRCNHCHCTQPGRDMYHDGKDVPFKVTGPGRKIK